MGVISEEPQTQTQPLTHLAGGGEMISGKQIVKAAGSQCRHPCLY